MSEDQEFSFKQVEEKMERKHWMKGLEEEFRFKYVKEKIKNNRQITVLEEKIKAVLKEKTKNITASSFNQLPDRGNLFLRYMTGLGNRNLDLDDKTINSLRESTYKAPAEAYKERVFGPTGEVYKEYQGGDWDWKPRSGAVNPYGKGYGSEVTQTLGRFNAEVNPEKTNIRVTDTYDMVNEHEDPDLISGKFQPKKAVKSAYDSVKDIPKYGFGGFNLSHLGRSAMYASPTKPVPFDVDINIPYKGPITDREIYK